MSSDGSSELILFLFTKSGLIVTSSSKCCGHIIIKLYKVTISLAAGCNGWGLRDGLIGRLGLVQGLGLVTCTQNIPVI